MPPNYQNSLGWLDLNLRADRLKQQQQQDFQREQMSREQQQQDIQNALSVGKLRFQTEADRENRKLQLADMMARVKLQEEGKTARQDDKQAFEQPKIDAMVKKALADAGYAEARTAEVPLESARRDTNVASQVAERDTRHDDRRYAADMGFAGKLTARDPNTGQQLMTMAPGGKVAGIAEGLGLVPNLTPPGEVPLGKEYPKVLQQLAVEKKDVDMLKNLDAALSDPAQADPSDFGNTGDKVGVKAFGMNLTPNTIGDFFETPASKRRSALAIKINAPLNEFMRKYGAALTETELGRAVGEAGLQQALNGEFSPFATPLPVLQASIKQLLSEHERALAVSQQEASTRTRRLEPEPRDGQRREPPPQMAPSPLDTQETPEAARKRRIEVGRRDPEIKAKLKAARDALPPDMPPEQKAEELHKILEQLVP